LKMKTYPAMTPWFAHCVHGEAPELARKNGTAFSFDLGPRSWHKKRAPHRLKIPQIDPEKKALQPSSNGQTEIQVGQRE